MLSLLLQTLGVRCPLGLGLFVGPYVRIGPKLVFQVAFTKANDAKRAHLCDVLGSFGKLGLAHELESGRPGHQAGITELDGSVIFCARY